MKKIFSLVSLVMLVTLMSVSLVSAEPPFQTSATSGIGLQLFTPQYGAIAQDQDFKFHLHVSNISTGLQLNNTEVDCFAHLYGSDGSHLFESGLLDKKSNGVDHEQIVLAGNFTELGTYGSYVWCNTTDGTLGGEVKGVFQVTRGGSQPDGLVIIFFSFLFIVICFEMLGLLLWTILHFIEINVDAKDLILNVSSYFALWAFYVLSGDYLLNPFVDSFTLFLIEMGAVTMVIIPLIGFVVSFIKQNTEKGDH